MSDEYWDNHPLNPTNEREDYSDNLYEYLKKDEAIELLKKGETIQYEGWTDWQEVSMEEFINLDDMHEFLAGHSDYSFRK